MTAAAGCPSAISCAMFGPERIENVRPLTRDESRPPVSGSSPLVRLRSGAVPGRDSTTSPNERLGTAATMTSAPSKLSSLRSRPANVDVVAAGAEQPAEDGSPRPLADDDEPHQLLRTKSIETGTPSRSKRSRSWFSTQ